MSSAATLQTMGGSDTKSGRSKTPRRTRSKSRGRTTSKIVYKPLDVTGSGEELPLFLDGSNSVASSQKSSNSKRSNKLKQSTTSTNNSHRSRSQKRHSLSVLPTNLNVPTHSHNANPYTT